MPEEDEINDEIHELDQDPIPGLGDAPTVEVVEPGVKIPEPAAEDGEVER